MSRRSDDGLFWCPPESVLSPNVIPGFLIVIDNRSLFSLHFLCCSDTFKVAVVTRFTSPWKPELLFLWEEEAKHVLEI